METIYALAIGVLTGSGVWLLLRPRTFQVIVGLSLLSYAVNLFIFGMGRLLIGGAPIIETLSKADPALYDDPVPQALVLTAIVIGFATTALFLVVLLASRGLDRQRSCGRQWAGSMSSWMAHLPVLPVVIPLIAGAAMLLFVEAQRRERTIIAFAATPCQI